MAFVRRGSCGFLVATLFGSLFTQSALALDEWRTQVQVSVRSGNDVQIERGGGQGLSSSELELSTASNSAISRASSALNGGGFIPTLRAHAIADPTRSQAVAWGVQGYTNTSSNPIDTGLVLEIDAGITGANDLEARVYLFQEAGFEFWEDPGTMLFESSSRLWPGFDKFANNLGPMGFDIDINDRPGGVNEIRQFDFTVAPGESFYVWARLVATANEEGEVDAFSTLTASLTNTTGLSPAGRTEEPQPAFLRGDCNDDGAVDISDAVCTLEWLFLGSDAPGCVAATNTNGDEAVDISDPVSLLGFLFLGGTSPLAPFPDCGTSDLETDQDLGCESQQSNCQ